MVRNVKMSINQVIQADVTCNHVPSDMLFWEGHGTNVGIVSADRAPSAPSHEGTADRPKLRDFPQGNSPVLFKNVNVQKIKNRLWNSHRIKETRVMITECNVASWVES